MEGYYCETKESALQKVLEIIPKDSMVSCGGSATLHEIGLQDSLKKQGYNFYLMSSNAISATGELVNADGYGNRVAALIFA